MASDPSTGAAARRTLLVGVGLACATGAHAACPATPGELTGHVYRATQGYMSANLDAFTGARDAAREAVACLDRVLAPSDAAALHRLEGLDAYLARDSERVLSSFRASIAVQPAYDLPPEIAPEGNPLRDLYAQARLSPPLGEVAVELADGASLFVDGRTRDTRPIDRPAVLQVVDPLGDLVWTGYRAGAEPVPETLLEGVAAASPPSAEPAQPTPARPVRPARGGGGGAAVGVLAVGTGLTAAAAGTLWGVALASRGAYTASAGDIADNQADLSHTELEAQRQQVNRLGRAAQAVTAVAGGLGVGLVLTVAL